MSTVQTPANIPAGTPPPQDNKVVVISHSNLFYWWPVWAVAFLMAGLTAIDDHFLVTVPKGTIATKKIEYNGEVREAYVLPPGGEVTRESQDRYKEIRKASAARDPRIHMAKSKNYGVIFCAILLLVIVITNIPLRGMWSVVIIITTIMMTVILALAKLWDDIFNALYLLDIRINMGGYLFIGIGLFFIWLFTVLLFDKQIYIVFEPGQFKVCTEIGGGEKAYDTIGMTLERQRSDLFRHMILGLGSGDLIVRTTGAQAHQFDLPNVLFIS